VIPSAHPSIGSLAPGVERPQWSVMIPTYNCAELLRATLQSVLDQDPGPDAMQIEVVDDCSTTDRPDHVVAELADGRVTFWRQPTNLGIGRNFTSCLERAKGHWVHVLHGDDLAYAGLYRTVGDLLSANPEIGGVVVGAEDIDEQGSVIQANIPIRPTRQELTDFEQGIFSWNPVRAPAVIARRSVYEGVGGFHPNLRYCADWDMWKRIAVATRLLYEPEVLVGYRVHSQSDTAKLGTSVAQLKEMIRSVRIAHNYIPDGRSRGWTRDFYGTIRSWAWDMLSPQPGRPIGRDLLGYSRIVVESTVRSHTDRMLARTSRRASP
jgi:glycosyltransferase involved in cell wall biosynthesis